VDELLSIFLPVYFLAFFGLAFFWPTWRNYKKTGVNPYRLKDSRGPERVVSRYFGLLPVAALLVVGAWLLGDPWYGALAPITWLALTPLVMFGMALMCTALVVVLVAQQEMGNSWRIGVDHDNPTEFVHEGLFGYSRNPIFLGIMLCVVGYFMVLPNAVTLLIMVLGLALIQVQISIEEEHLSEAHGAEYESYCARVRRWL